MFEQAVNEYFRRGWLPIPLVLDSNGFPKKPFTPGWTSLKRDAATVRGLPWNRALGLGIALGPVSGNLAALDLDDVEFGQAVFERCVQNEVLTRIVRTIRKRLHLYVVETAPSASSARTVTWQGRTFKVELKAAGTQVAAPPTPGYDLLMDEPVMVVPTIRDAWLSIAAAMGVTESSDKPEGFPKPWKPAVTENRNQTAYIEAHKLREAGIPLEQAKDLMRLRVESTYKPGNMHISEIIKTVESAYKKGEIPDAPSLLDTYSGEVDTSSPEVKQAVTRWQRYGRPRLALAPTKGAWANWETGYIANIEHHLAAHPGDAWRVLEMLP